MARWRVDHAAVAALRKWRYWVHLQRVVSHLASTSLHARMFRRWLSWVDQYTPPPSPPPSLSLVRGAGVSRPLRLTITPFPPPLFLCSWRACVEAVGAVAVTAHLRARRRAWAALCAASSASPSTHELVQRLRARGQLRRSGGSSRQGSWQHMHLALCQWKLLPSASAFRGWVTHTADSVQAKAARGVAVRHYNSVLLWRQFCEWREVGCGPPALGLTTCRAVDAECLLLLLLLLRVISSPCFQPPSPLLCLSVHSGLPYAASSHLVVGGVCP